MISVTNQAWRFDAAQTNAALVTVDSTHRVIVYGAFATCANANTVDVSLRIGFGASTLPTITVNSTTGGTGVPISHPGIAKGGGFVWSGGGEPIGAGAAGEDVLMTNSVPTGGALDITLAYRIDSTAE